MKNLQVEKCFNIFEIYNKNYEIEQIGIVPVFLKGTDDQKFTALKNRVEQDYKICRTFVPITEEESIKLKVIKTFYKNSFNYETALYDLIEKKLKVKFKDCILNVITPIVDGKVSFTKSIGIK